MAMKRMLLRALQPGKEDPPLGQRGTMRCVRRSGPGASETRTPLWRAHTESPAEREDHRLDETGCSEKSEGRLTSFAMRFRTMDSTGRRTSRDVAARHVGHSVCDWSHC